MECVKHCQDINDYFNQKQNACWLRLVVIKSLLGKKEKKKVLTVKTALHYQVFINLSSRKC